MSTSGLTQAPRVNQSTVAAKRRLGGLYEGKLRVSSVEQPTCDGAPGEQELIAGSLFEAFNERDLRRALELVHPDIVFLPVTATLLRDGQPYQGYEGIRRYMADIETNWEELVVHPTQIRAAGRAVVALGEVSGRGPAGAFEGVSTTWVLKFKDGLVVHAQIFSDAANAKRALGEN
jgi:ketosteroid isomerase-like protein